MFIFNIYPLIKKDFKFLKFCLILKILVLNRKEFQMQFMNV